MATQRFINIVSGKFKQIVASVTGTADAIPAGDATGKLDISWMPVGVGQEVLVAATSENLTAGDFVNLYLNGNNILDSVRRKAYSQRSKGDYTGGVL